MIAQLRGTVVAAGATWVLIDVGGVGYRTLCTPAVAAAARIGEPVTLATSLVVREDSMTLYGFADAEERDTFELVQSASGIGPRIAQAVVAVLPPPELRAAIASENVTVLTKVPGIGPKGAKKMVLELKDKIGALAALSPPDAAGAPAPASDWHEQVKGGLESLGWSARAAELACERVEPLAKENPALGVGELMKAALRGLAR